MLECLAAGSGQLEDCGCGPRCHALLGLGLGIALTGMAPGARAADGTYEAMLVNCIDPRSTAASHGWMVAQGMRGQFVGAGGPIGAIHSQLAAWHGTFRDNLAISMHLQAIKQVVAFTHRDCGAAKLAFGAAGVATTALQGASHACVLQAFREAVDRRDPALIVVAGNMALDGSVEPV